MKSSVLFVFFICSLQAFSQHIGRKVIQGIVISDSLQVENVTVRNTTANTFVISDAKGNFNLLAKEKDTLVFSGVSFKSSSLIVSYSHLSDEYIKIRLSVKINELEELIVRPYTLTGNLETDTKKLKVKTIDLNLDAVDFSTPEVKFNPVKEGLKSVLPATESALTGIDFMKIGKMIGRAIFKPKPKEKKIEFITDKNFIEAVKEKFTSGFFTATLKLKPEQVELFLSYCDKKPVESRKLLNPKNEFELIDFLIKKSEEYLKIQQ